MRKTLQVLAACFVTAGVLAGCSDSPMPKTEAKREGLAADTEAAVRRMTASDPSLREFLDRAYGYAVFPSIGKGGFVVGGSYGRGEVYREGRQVGYADVTAISAGLLAGGQTITELVVFGTESAFNSFTRGEYSLGANASVVALQAGAAAGRSSATASSRSSNPAAGSWPTCPSKASASASAPTTAARAAPRPPPTRAGRTPPCATSRNSSETSRTANAATCSKSTNRSNNSSSRSSSAMQQKNVSRRARGESRGIDGSPGGSARAAPTPAPEPLPIPEPTPTPEPTPAPEPRDTTDDGPAIRGEIEVGPDAANKDEAPPRGTSGQAGQSE